MAWAAARPASPQCSGTAYGATGSTNPSGALYGYTAGCEGLILAAGNPGLIYGRRAP